MLRKSTKDTTRIRNIRQKLDGLKKLLNEHDVNDVFTYKGYELLIDCLIKNHDVISQNPKLEAKWREVYLEIVDYVAHTLNVEMTDIFRMIDPRDYFTKGVREKIHQLSIQNVNKYLEELMDIVPYSLNKASFTFDKEKQILKDNILGVALTLEFWIRVADVCYRKKSPPNLALVNAIVARLCPNDMQELITKLVSKNAQTMFNRMKTFTVLNPQTYAERYAKDNVIPVFFFLEAKTERLDDIRRSELPDLDETKLPNQIHAPRYEMVQHLKNNIRKLPTIVFSKSKNKLFKTLHNAHISGGEITKLNLSNKDNQLLLEYKHKLFNIDEKINITLTSTETFDKFQIKNTKKEINKFKNGFNSSNNDDFINRLYTNEIYEVNVGGLTKLIDPMNESALTKVLACTFKMRTNVKFFNPQLTLLDEKDARELDHAISRVELFATFLNFLTKSEKAAYLTFICEVPNLFDSNSLLDKIINDDELPTRIYPNQSLLDALINDVQLPSRIKVTLLRALDSIVDDENLNDHYIKKILSTTRENFRKEKAKLEQELLPTNNPSAAKSEDILDLKKFAVTEKIKEKKRKMERIAEAKAIDEVHIFKNQYQQFKNDIYIDPIYEYEIDKRQDRAEEVLSKITTFELESRIDTNLTKVLASTFKIANDIEFLNPTISIVLDENDIKNIDDAISRANVFLKFLNSLTPSETKTYLIFLCSEKLDQYSARPFLDDLIDNAFIPARIKVALLKILSTIINDKNLADDGSKAILLAAYERFDDRKNELEKQHSDILDVKKSKASAIINENIKTKERDAFIEARNAINDFNKESDLHPQEYNEFSDHIYEILDPVLNESTLTKVMASTHKIITDYKFFNPSLSSKLDETDAIKIDLAIAKTHLFMRFLNSLTKAEKAAYMIYLCSKKEPKALNTEDTEDTDRKPLLDVIITNHHVPERLKVALFSLLSEVAHDKNLPERDILQAARIRMRKAREKFEHRIYPNIKKKDIRVPDSNEILDSKRFKVKEAMIEKAKTDEEIKSIFNPKESEQKQTNENQSMIGGVGKRKLSLRKIEQPLNKKENQNRSLPSTPEQKRSQNISLTGTPEEKRSVEFRDYYTSEAYLAYKEAQKKYFATKQGEMPTPPPMPGRRSKPSTHVIPRIDKDQSQGASPYVNLSVFANKANANNQPMDPVTDLFNQLLTLSTKCADAIAENCARPETVTEITIFQKEIAKMLPNTLYLQGLESADKKRAFKGMEEKVERIQKALDVLSNRNKIQSSFI